MAGKSFFVGILAKILCDRRRFSKHIGSLRGKAKNNLCVHNTEKGSDMCVGGYQL